MRELKCLRCQADMNHVIREKIQLGQTGWILGDLPNLISGAIEVDIYSCPQCGKIEFFQPSDEDEGNGLAQVKCPNCGREHDFDYPKCPFCKHDYYKRK